MKLPAENQNRLSWIATLLFAASWAACGSDDPGEGAECAQGDTAACTCPDGSSGERACGEDGLFGACAMCSDTGDPDAAPPEISFQQDIVPMFEASCGAQVNGCHSREAYGANRDMGCRGWLSLENAAIGSEFYAGPMQGQQTGCPDISLYERLIELAPWQCDADARTIRPGNPDESYMMMKINGAPLCDLSPGEPSAPMPPPDSGYAVPSEAVDTLRAWILAGAPNN